MNKDIIKYGIILVGAYLVYRYVQEHGGIEHLLVGTQPVITPPPDNKTPPPDNKTPATTATNLKDRVAAAAASQGSSFNLDQWCWFYSHVSGKPCPDPDVEWPAVDRTAAVDINGFWNLMQSAGLGFVVPAFQQTYPSWLM